MPDNPLPAAQPESGAEPSEFNFDKGATQNPRIKRRSLKAKPGGLSKPAENAVAAARDLEREAPPHASTPTQPSAPAVSPAQASLPAKAVPVVVKSTDAPPAPPRTTPATAAKTAPATTAAKVTLPSTTKPTTSPHGTRPATLYYSSYPRKDKEASPTMKSIPPGGPSSPASAASTAKSVPTTAARTTTPAPTRPAPNIDYRANVERQTREQKSVGNILAYIVYGLIAFFVISAALACYGGFVLSQRITDQSITVSDLDGRYAAANKDLTAKLAAAQDAISQTQAQIARQQDVIVKQQEELSRLITSSNDIANLLKTEKQARAQETASLRARVRDLENRQVINR